MSPSRHLGWTASDEVSDLRRSPGAAVRSSLSLRGVSAWLEHEGKHTMTDETIAFQVVGTPKPIDLSVVKWRPDGRSFEQGGGHRCRYVAYIDARHAAEALDEWVGPLNWRDTYTPAPEITAGAMWCKVEVRDPATNEWVGKWDIGVESNFAQAKGLVSDAFKRACVKWGVGRNIYDLPMMYASCKVGTGGKGVFPHPDAQKEIDAELKKKGITAGAGVAGGDEPEPVKEAPAKKKAPAKKAAPKKVEPEPKVEPGAEPHEFGSDFNLDVVKLRERINLLDDEGKVAIKMALMTHELTKKDLQNANLSEDQVASLWKLVDAESDRMGEPFGLGEEG